MTALDSRFRGNDGKGAGQQVSSMPLFIRHARVGGHPVVEQMVERFIIQMTVLDSRFHGNDGQGPVWFA